MGASVGLGVLLHPEALNLPLPVQAHLPILVGGGGKRRTLRTVAKYADACNVGGGSRA